MAEEAKEKKTKKEQQENKSAMSKVLPWVIFLVVVVIFCGGGFFLGNLLADKQGEKKQQEQKENKKIEEIIADPNTGNFVDTEKSWYHELEPVVAFLNEPDVTRLVRANLVLEVSGELPKKDGEQFLEDKKPLIVNWLTIYLSGLKISDIRGDRNLKRIQHQIKDAFNEKFFPNSKPMIKRVLFKEFAIQ